MPDIIATFGSMINLHNGLGKYDDIDSLNNRRIRTTCELLMNQLRIGMSRIEKNTKERISAKDISMVTVKNVTNNKLLKAAFREFFNSSQLSQFMDQVNPLAEISNKRRITALGPGGLSRDTASLVVRGIHDTHYGRICPIETPEGPNIGLILNLALYAKVDEYGFIRTPYSKVKDGKVTNETIYLLADDEKKYFIAQKSLKTDATGKILEKEIIVRHNGSFISVDAKTVTHIDVSPKQIISLATSCIPFLENNDANRALMGANMQRQALPLIDVNAPIVATGSEQEVAKYVSTVLKAKDNGVVEYVDGNKIEVKYVKHNKGKTFTHILSKFERSNQTTTINQVPRVEIGQKVKLGDILADGPAVDNGELALGQNVLVAFTT
jgi:DNA-directed RNA polymerase subunit beta